MKLSVALFFAGLFGALATVFILLSFWTDYWLVASETCERNSTHKDISSDAKVYHEGFFWRCSFAGSLDNDPHLTWMTNQPHSKECWPSYLFPYPVSQQTHNATANESAIIYRGFWSVFMLIGVTAVVLGGFFIICGAPFASHRLYKAGGGLFLISALFLLLVVVMFVLWVEVYMEDQRLPECPKLDVNINYGMSFFFALVGISLCLLAGLIFLLIGRSIQKQCN